MGNKDKESRVDGNHVRTTSKDGHTSWLYKENSSGGNKTCVERTDHLKDGTSKSFHSDNSVFGQLFNGGRGKAK